MVLRRKQGCLLDALSERTVGEVALQLTKTPCNVSRQLDRKDLGVQRYKMKTNSVSRMMTSLIAVVTLGLFSFAVPETFALQEVGVYYTPSDVSAVQVNGNWTYLANNRQLYFVDTSNLANIRLANVFTVSGDVGVHGIVDIAFANNYIYAWTCNERLIVVNVANPYSPVQLSNTAQGDVILRYAQQVRVAGNRVYGATKIGQGVSIIDVSKPSAPRKIGSIDTMAHLAVPVGNRLYVGHGNGDGLLVYDISNASAPRLLGSSRFGFSSLSVNGIEQVGAFLVLATSGGMLSIDASDPLNMRRLDYKSGEKSRMVAMADSSVAATHWGYRDGIDVYQVMGNGLLFLTSSQSCESEKLAYGNGSLQGINAPLGLSTALRIYRTPPPPAPSSITYPTSSSLGVYTVEWEASPGATSYRLERSNNGGSTWTLVYQGPNLSRLDGVANGSYRYRVYASNSSGSSSWCTGWQNCAVNIPDRDGAVYRFWSPVFSGHFFTMNVTERNNIITGLSAYWTYEGVAWYAYPTRAAGTIPVYRFWSPVFSGHFFTMNETEKNNIISQLSAYWTYEGVAWYAYPTQVVGTVPVYRFWSPVFAHHFFTVNEVEKRNIISGLSAYWTYEGIAYYANTSATRDVLAKASVLKPSEELTGENLTLSEALGLVSESAVVVSGAEIDGSSATGIPLATISDVGDVVFPLSYPGREVTAYVYDSLTDQWTCVLPATNSPDSATFTGILPDRSYRLEVFAGDPVSGEMVRVHGSWFESSREAPATITETVEATSVVSHDGVGSSILRIKTPVVEGTLTLKLYSSSQGVVKTLTDVSGGDTVELSIPEWNRWFWVGGWRDSDDELVLSLWLRHETEE